MLFQDYGPADGMVQLDTNVILVASQQSSSNAEPVTMAKANMAGKFFHRPQAAVIEKADTILRQVDDRVLQLPFVKIVRFFNDECGANEVGINDPITLAAIGP